MITVIIPTLNEAAHIGQLLAWLAEDAPDDLAEIIVADGGSQDRTCAIVTEAAEAGQRVRLLNNPDRIQAAGINMAAAAADPRTTILIRLDAHAGYPPGYVQNLRDVLKDTGADSVVVRLRTEASGCFQKAVGALSNSRLGTGGAAHRVGGASGWIDHGHHAAFLRSSFAGVGGYDRTFVANEDAEFDVRLRRAGGRIWFASELEIAYHPRRTLGALARQYFRYGRGRARNLLKNRERLRLRQCIPPLLVIGLVIALAMTPIVPWMFAIPLAYFGAALCAGLALALSARDFCLLAAALALPAMHLAWGAGFLITMTRRNVFEEHPGMIQTPSHPLGAHKIGDVDVRLD
jgi:succinoglycan biosynthesis protein ExoA